MRRYPSNLPLHQKTLWVWIIMFSRSISPLILLELTYIQPNWTLNVCGLEKRHQCKIIHITSGLQGCHLPCSWNIRLENYILNSLCMGPSYRREKWWCTVSPIHPWSQERRTTWRFSYCLDEKSDHIFRGIAFSPPFYEQFCSSFKSLKFSYWILDSLKMSKKLLKMNY